MKHVQSRRFLIVSIMLNLVLFGVLAGLMLSQSGPGRGTRTPISLADRAEQRTVRTILQDTYAQARSERDAYIAAKQTLYATLSAPTLNADLARDQFATLRQTEDAMRMRMQTSLLAKMPTLSPSQRASIAARLLSDRREARRQRHSNRLSPTER